jgi:uncharacterized protein YqjF (DUF2071 family)
MATESFDVSRLAPSRRGPFPFRQGWRDLLFAHWPVAQQLVRDRLPPGLELDVWKGNAWIGVVPFRLVGLRPRWLPGLPTATGARTLFGLPYHRAEMRFARDGDWVTYSSHRRDSAAVFEARYRATGFETVAAAGSLEEFLVERYRLFSVDDGRVGKVEIDHPPWKLRPALAEIHSNTMTLASGIPLPDQEPLVHFVVQQDVLTGPPVAVRG